MSGFADFFIHGRGGFASVAHGENHGGSPADYVAAGEEHRDGGLKGLGVGHECASAGDLQPLY